MDNIQLIYELDDLIKRQVEMFLGEDIDVREAIPLALEKTMKCLQMSRGKYFNGQFNRLHTGQNSMFLWHLSNVVSMEMGLKEEATKIYYLNKILHSVEWYHEIMLPSIWGVEHPVGSVLGRAEYHDFFFIYQACTVGMDIKGGNFIS